MSPQLLLPLGDEFNVRRVDWLSCVTGLPLGWDRTHPAYVRYGLGPVLNVPRQAIYAIRAINRWE